MRVGILGGGIIGLSSAYYLQRAGHQVTIIDQDDLQIGCSTGNAGMIVPSHLIPLASPGMISKGIRWMFNSTSPFYVKPRWSGDLIKWGYHFYQHANKEHVAKAAIALKEISLFSKSIYQQWAKELPFDFEYHERGLLMLYQTKEAEHEESETAHFANKHGIEAHILNSSEVQNLEPHVKVQARGGVFFPGDAHLTPQLLMSQLIPYLKHQGVVFKTKSTLTDFIVESQKIRELVSSTERFSFDEVILASGSWSGAISKKLNVNLPMQAGKGYSLLTPIQKNIQVPSIFLEARVAVTPMGNNIRFGGTMEIAGVNHSINMNRVKGIVDSIPKYYPEMSIPMPLQSNVWHGLRPCSPDGLPYIGRSKQIKNLTIATGHAMMGLSLGPGTGKLVQQIIDQNQTSISMEAFNPERYN
ncbi:MAG: FAD-dependent oxidoreductase [Cyclobacteriaceae bacterium]|nr:FAD-dependent oxidoreductase [Cyclobacteriaceae bacterium]